VLAIDTCAFDYYLRLRLLNLRFRLPENSFTVSKLSAFANLERSYWYNFPYW